MAIKLTTRKPNTANNVSHALNRTKRKQNLNLQTKKINGVQVSLTNREWRTLKKEM